MKSRKHQQVGCVFAREKNFYLMPMNDTINAHAPGLPDSSPDPRIKNVPIPDLQIEQALEVGLDLHQFFGSLLHILQIARRQYL